MSTPTDTKPEETPEPTEEPTPPLVQWTDGDGKTHTDHPVHTECVGGCYQVIKA
ncbi:MULTISPECIES: hypothetical protein [unclassified Amycolatopsis]|uniref:hypothetical protein n=1 Tax=unclassified Amycolatopsis TaxID=2618356 RepID=UPI002E1F01AE|nr:MULTISPECIES: hypothetical protein [unclassified Amycolatopsis]